MRDEKVVKGFKDLKVWQKAFDLSLRVYRMTASFPKAEMHGLVSQMRRASVSIAANIAEGGEALTGLLDEVQRMLSGLCSSLRRPRPSPLAPRP